MSATDFDTAAARVRALVRYLAGTPDDAAAAYELADLAIDHYLEDEAVDPVARAAERHGGEPRLWQMLGLLHRGREQSAAAIDAFGRAAALAPGDVRIAHGLALATWEAGLPASDAYAQALRLAPLDGGLLLGEASARFAEGQGGEALDRLATLLREHPGWIAGHHGFAKLAAALGETERLTEALDHALATSPADAALLVARLSVLTRSASPQERLARIAEARSQAGDQRVFTVQEALARSEAGDIAGADRLFLAIGRHDDPALALATLRHLVRAQRFDQADVLAGHLVDGPEAVTAWAYRHTAWRALGDPRLAWLEAGVGIHDIADRLPPLDRLADLLRTLHVSQGAPLDQSVRHGTQTDGPLFARVEPDIQALRAAVHDTVARHIADLPPLDRHHPLLSLRRDRPVRFAGSWSVRLRGAGHHANHIHGHGWLSSALYIALPDAVDRGEGGALQLGAPPEELGTGLGPTRTIAPKPGRLVLFPSYLWHGTTPFADGERLTVAFDVARPGG